MKKVICFSSFLLLLLLPMLLSAQLPTRVFVPTGPGTEVPTTVTLPGSGDLTFHFSVLVANLDLVNGVACNDNYEETQTLVLPRSYPPMYLEYTINGVTDTVFVNNFEREWCPYDAWFNNNTSSFIFRHPVTVNFLDECRNNESDFSVSLSTRLLTSAGGIYPICDYTSSGDIFACNSDFFPAIYCSSLSGACNSADHAEWADIYTFRCADLGETNASGRSDDINEDNAQLKDQNLSIQASPNPFSTQVNIRLNADMENATLRLFSVDGKLLQEKTNLNLEGNENLQLDTDHLTKGIYFLQIQNKSETVFTKLIKS